MSDTPMPAGRALPADRFHSGLRLATLAAWVIAVALVFGAGRVVVHAIFGPAAAGSAALLLAVAAIVLAQPLAYWAEKRLLSVWPSGRAVRLEDGALTLQEKTGAVRIDLAQKIGYWRWRFEIRGRRGGRVPSGHHCLAVRLIQNERAVSLYAFASPKQMMALMSDYAFHEIRRSGDKGPRAASVGARESVLLAAERERWDSGAELEPGDFETLLAYLAAHVPEFAASPSS
jgi:hypothetical protein